MHKEQSETNWLHLLKLGEQEATRKLWERYFHRLLGLARKKLASGPRRVADEEDVAISAFHSFCRGAAADRFAQLQDRNDLWQVLAMIATRKAARQLQRERAEKRGGGQVRGESAFTSPNSNDSGGGIDGFAVGDPTPEFMAIVDEQFEQLLDRLPETELRKIALAKLEGFTNAEIAQQIGRHERSVERKLQLIRKHWDDRAE